MVHVFNSIIMLIDLTIVGHPIKLSHVTWTMGVGLVYSIFTAIYFLSGGTTRFVVEINTLTFSATKTGGSYEQFSLHSWGKHNMVVGNMSH